MVFFNMIPSLAPVEQPKHNPKHRAKTLKRQARTHIEKTAKLHRGRKIKMVARPKKMRGGFAGDSMGGCDTTGLITEPNINIPSIIKGLDMGLSINKTIARIEKSTKN